MYGFESYNISNPNLLYITPRLSLMVKAEIFSVYLKSAGLKTFKILVNIALIIAGKSRDNILVTLTLVAAKACLVLFQSKD